MKSIIKILLSLLLLLNSCISQFVPDVSEDKELVVVEGIITNQPGAYTIKLSKSLPLGAKNTAKPMKGCSVIITDDLGRSFTMKEAAAGTYVSDPSKFQGSVGRSYTLHVTTSTATNSLKYESYPMKMNPVPLIDSVFYEKVTIRQQDPLNYGIEGAQLYLNTHDPADNCMYYRWEFSETWEFHLPYSVPNSVCWVTNNSSFINIKNTSVMGENRINRYPLTFISHETDRLAVKYSILVNQYSLNEEEFIYWEKLQTISEQVGGLYDITPSSIPSNVYCLNDPTDKVLGYFSVSANSSKRIFIKDNFLGPAYQYSDCIADTIYGTAPIPGLNSGVWVLFEETQPPPYRVITYNKGCADCTVRGTKIVPSFWK